MTVTLGPHASLILGLLGHPMTADEILDLINKGLAMEGLVDAFADVGWGLAIGEVRTLRDRGADGITVELVRLQQIGLVDCVAVAGDQLWRRLPL